MKTKYKIEYCIKWKTKNNQELITANNVKELKKLLFDISEELNLTIKSCKINGTTVLLIVDSPPNISVSKIVQFLKGKTSKTLTSIIWDNGYMCTTGQYKNLLHYTAQLNNV